MKQLENKISSEKSYYFLEKPQTIREEHFALSTWMLIAFLVVTFIALKSFIYIQDEKRKNR